MKEANRVRRGDVVVAVFSDARGAEIRKRRPFVVVSPDELNESGRTFLAAGLTTGHHPYHFTVPCKFANRSGHVVLDQVLTFDASRVGPPIGRLSAGEMRSVLTVLREMFEE